MYRTVPFRRVAIALFCLAIGSTLNGAAGQTTVKEQAAQSSLATDLKSALVASCKKSDSLSSVTSMLAGKMSGSDVASRYRALSSLEGDTDLCSTALQAVSAAKATAIATICGTPALAKDFPELGCIVTGAVQQSGGESAAAFRTGGTQTPTGTGY